MTEVSQVAYSTQDIEATALDMVAKDGVGPFFFAEFPLYDLTYQGKAAHYDRIQVAFGYKGDLQIELLQVPAGGHSIYAEGIAGRRELFHHSYVKSDEDYDAIVARHEQAGEMATYKGVSLAGEDRIRFCYVDARERLGHFVEILETKKMVGPAARIFDVYEQMKQAAKGWDGKDPIRQMADLF